MAREGAMHTLQLMSPESSTFKMQHTRPALRTARILI